MDQITSSPLCWPEGWQRSEYESSSRFGKWNKPVSIGKATDKVLHELSMMGIGDWNVIMSSDLKLRNDGLPYSNQKSPEDCGISVWWMDGDQQRVIALDQYDRIADNLYAIGKTIEAMRGIERWGGGEILNRTFTGFTALPSPEQAAAPSWRDALGYYGNDIDEMAKCYKKKRSENHPDKGGNEDIFHLVCKAYELAKQELT